MQQSTLVWGIILGVFRTAQISTLDFWCHHVSYFNHHEPRLFWRTLVVDLHGNFHRKKLSNLLSEALDSGIPHISQLLIYSEHSLGYIGLSIVIYSYIYDFIGLLTIHSPISQPRRVVRD